MEQQQAQQTQLPQPQHRKELFKERASAKDRTYFFDVKESIKGSKYLVINESKKVGDKFEYSRIMIFEDQLEIFTNGFKKAYEFMQSK